MTQYVPLSPYMDMTLPLHVNQLGESGYSSKQLVDVPYFKGCLPSDLGIPGYEDNSSNNHLLGYGSCNSIYDNLKSRPGKRFDESNGIRHNSVSFSEMVQSSTLQLDGLRYECPERKLDPYSPLCMVPLPDHLLEPNFIRRRNERERERVRCVNEGYDRLKQHLPLHKTERRISKVETLRCAIEYIRALQGLLKEAESKTDSCDSYFSAKTRKRRHSSGSNDWMISGSEM